MSKLINGQIPPLHVCPFIENCEYFNEYCPKRGNLKMVAVKCNHAINHDLFEQKKKTEVYEIKLEMNEYFRELSQQKKADQYRSSTGIFNIGEGDILLFPQLKDVDQLWVLPSGNVQLIHKKSIAGRVVRGRNFGG